MLCDRFPFYSIVYNLEARHKKAVNIHFSGLYFETINLANAVKVLVDRVSNLLLSTSSNTSTTTTITNRECEVSEMLCIVLESSTTSHSHFFEVGTTLDHESVDGKLIYDVEYVAETEDAFDHDWNGDEDDEEKVLCKESPLGYMAKAVNPYDKTNPKTSKRKRR